MKFTKLVKADQENDIKILNLNKNIYNLCKNISALSHRIFRAGMQDEIDESERLKILENVENELNKIKAMFPYK